MSASLPFPHEAGASTKSLPPVEDDTEISRFVSAPPYIPSYLTPVISDSVEIVSEKNSPSDINLLNNTSPLVSDQSSSSNCAHVTESQKSLFDVSAMNAHQFDMFMELIPSEIQDLLQVNLSHLRNARGISSSEGIQSLRLKAASLTFNQLSIQQLTFVSEAWNLIFGSGDGDVDEDPDATFAYRDEGLLPDEEEWFFSQIMNEGNSEGRIRATKSKYETRGRRKVKK